MKIALAQIQPDKGDIQNNLAKHLHWITQAAQQKVDLIVFSELSLTGYEPNLAKDLAFNLSDDRLDIFQDSSDRYKMNIAIGAPTLAPEGIHISLLLFQPFKERGCYSKQYLHIDEQAYFTPGPMSIAPTWKVHDYTCALAICYEISIPAHLERAISNGPDSYLSSSAKSQSGVQEAYSRLSSVAKTHSLPTFFVNGVGPADDFLSYGSSAIWDNKGRLESRLSSNEEGLLIGNFGKN